MSLVKRALTLFVLLLLVNDAALRADVLWTEDGESGLSYVTTNVTEYPLLQSDVAGQGDYAFHLANPSFQDNWFAISQPVTIESDTKLFFQSRLGWATTAQVARIQASANDGATWPISIYSQPGSGGMGEGGFSLKEIDLASYASQTLQFRFYYDFTSGSAYPQTDAGVGWYVDDIQIADQLQKSPYSIGNPSPQEQLYLEYVNRARAGAVAEGNRLAAETDPSILSAYSYFNIDTQDIVNQFSASVTSGYLDGVAQPLSFNAALLSATELHSQDMLANEFQGHYSSSNPPSPFTAGYTPSQRAAAFGYAGGVGENVYAYSDSVREGHAAFDVDWGGENPASPDYNPAFAGQGMQNPAGHRRNIHDNDFKEFGVGLVEGSNGAVGPQIVTQNFGIPGDVTFITGVVYEDLNSNNFYDVGEGRSGVRIDVEGSAYYAVSTDSGGYSVPVSGDGSYDVAFSGGGFGSFATTALVEDGWNVKVDYLVSSPLFAADFSGNGSVGGEDLTFWQGAYGTATAGDANGDGIADGVDFVQWQREYGSGTSISDAAGAVPEPPSLSVFLAVAVCQIAARVLRGGNTLGVVGLPRG